MIASRSAAGQPRGNRVQPPLIPLSALPQVDNLSPDRRAWVKILMELKRISPEQARDLLESGEGYTYLDVRSVPEFEAGHAPGAKNIPLLHRTSFGMQPNQDFVAVCEKALGKDAKIITACMKGPRSMRAAQILIENGFRAVVDMRGGFHGESDPMGNMIYPGWASRGFPVTTEAGDDESYEGLSNG